METTYAIEERTLPGRKGKTMNHNSAQATQLEAIARYVALQTVLYPDTDTLRSTARKPARKPAKPRTRKPKQD